MDTEQAYVFPTSFSQQRLWFLDKLVPGSPFYNIFSAFPLRLQNVSALERALGEIVRRHESLRTTFDVVDDRPVQVVAPALTVTVPIIDLRHLAAAARDAEVQKLAQEEARRPFDLSRGPLLRATLLRSGDVDYTLLLTMHHIVSDGWSIGILSRELTTLYESYVTGRPTTLADLAVQYADFAVWQREWLTGSVLEEQLTYWRQQLEDVPVLKLPTDRPRPAVKSYRGARLPVQLPAALTADLRALSQREGATLFMTLLAAFYALLHRYTDQSDIVVGSPIAGRNRAEVEELIGFFVNTLVLRTTVTGESTFRELLGRVREMATAAYVHQDLPFETLVEAVHPARDLSRNPLFQVIFQLMNTPTGPAAGSSPTRPLDIYSGTAKFDLELSFAETPEGLAGHIEYSTDLFDERTCAALSRHYRTLLEGIVADPDAPLARLPMLTPGEREEVLLLSRGTRSNYPRDRAVHELFEERAAQRPDSIAVVDRDAEVTYRLLDRRANALARRLQAAGAGRGVRIGVCMERSASMITALLAVLKTGAAYVPLDPDYPKARIAFMLDDAQAPVVVTERRFADRLAAGAAEVLFADGFAEEEEQKPASSVVPEDIAYVMYTSGSTGVPKGVCIPHRAITRLVRETDYVALGANDRVAHASNTSFDAATFEIWGPLLAGGRIVVISKNTALSPAGLAAQIRRDAVTTLFITTALFNQIAAEEPTAFAPLDHLLFGGSAVDPKWVREVLDRGRPRRLLHVYGPTESTTYASWYLIDGVTPDATTVPIGRPLANTDLFVLDAGREPVPAGVAGELYIGGDGLATEYLDRPSLTAEKFVTSPFSSDPAARLYRTGDLVRRRGDGEIDFLGRIDEQIKIRGFRVELGEIEALLSQHPAVSEAVVVARPTTHGDKRLVAYVVLAEEGAAPDVEPAAAEQVESWQAVFDDHVYRELLENGDPTFNITGWNSTFTALMIPDAEMREWLDSTVARILALQPSRVLEIGCGTGMLLFRVAPQCVRYCGTDVSKAALQYVRQVLERPENALPQVRLMQRAADDFEGFEDGAFDVVVMNSVVQYFPSIEYLQSVLEGAMRVLAPGGRLFIGDVRSFPLLQMLHLSRELFRAEEGTTLATLRERAQTAMARETELAVAPTFFTSLPERLPAIGRAEIFPKSGRSENELTKFRYDLVLRTAVADALLDVPWREWTDERWTVSGVRQLITETDPRALGLAHVPNSRLEREARLLDWIGQADDAATAEELREVMASHSAEALHPQDLWDVGRELGYEVTISWARHGTIGVCDVAFVRAPGAAVRFPHESLARRGVAHYANHPLKRGAAKQLVPELRRWLAERLPDFEVPSAFVVLGSLPLTPNGKVDRRALPAPDATRPELEASFTLPTNETEQTLAAIWAEVLGIERVGIHDNFFELGGDSILTIQIVSRAKRAGLQLTPQQIFQHQTIAELTPVVTALVGMAPEQGVLTGDVPLTPIGTWFIEQDLADVHHFNQAVLFPIGAADGALMRECISTLLRHHDALRLRLVPDGGGCRQFYDGIADEVPFTEHDLRTLSAARQTTAIESEAARLQASLDPANGPMARFALFHLGPQKGDRFFAAIHHLAVDGVSWRILIDDLQACYAQLARGETLVLPAKTTSFQRWSQRLQQYASSPALLQELSFWLQGPVQALPLPVDHDRGANDVASSESLDVALSVDETAGLLQDVPAAFRTQVNEALLAALSQTLSRWSGRTALLFDVEGHGREDLFEGFDLSRTVGWFTSIFPVWLTVKSGARAGEMLKVVKEQLRRIPNRGIGYGVLRYLSEDGSIRERLAAQPAAQLSFNYLGQFGGARDEEHSAGESSGPMRSPRGARRYLIEVNGSVEDRALRMTWTYSRNRHNCQTILDVAEDFAAALRALVDESRRGDRVAYSPSDFPNLKLSENELNQLLTEIAGGGKAS